MTPHDFATWLRGFFDAHGSNLKGLDAEAVSAIRERLSRVTPGYAPALAPIPPMRPLPIGPAWPRIPGEVTLSQNSQEQLHGLPG